ncbi:hypothetical protein Mgra_00001775 [Meloidogyne graminicola]|uniref:Uncharacterized protein n=1 Tax=Meloidogyne graminicola TaxID=189291 RepID=A0A8S9ZZF4_9BILA|nr:hypothetical protein Mgra_00001775 [Meloidogyne graminicola]
MELNFAFYPLPTVHLPNLQIPDLKQYKYEFDNERLTIERYDSEKLYLENRNINNKHLISTVNEQRSLSEVSSTAQNIEKIDPIKFGVFSKNFSSSISSPSFFNLENDQINKMNAQTNSLLPLNNQLNAKPLLLHPQRSIEAKQVSTINSKQTKENNKNQIMKDLEEFEIRRPDLFDLVELQSIDDRLELSKLLVSSSIYSSSTNNNEQPPA